MNSKFRDREERWSRIWLENRVFEADPVPGRTKFFITFPFPYMNGSLHLGHAYTSGRLDVLARYLRMKGYNVLYPWAWHWTGEAVMGIIHRLEDGDEAVKRRLVELDGVDEEE
jgi:leucyl-tRNA synthetase